MSSKQFAQSRYSILITEIMADPTPVVGLPNAEWIELKNVSSLPVNLLNCRIADQSSQSSVLPSIVLLPDSILIICSSSVLLQMQNFGKAISVSGFPSLDNDGDVISLRNSSAQTIHAVGYNDNWYANNLKKDGGWSLEMIDTKQPCLGQQNWIASKDPRGGTPGKTNSVHGTLSDTRPLKLLRTYSEGDSVIILVFDEPMDSLNATRVNNFSIDNGLLVKKSLSVPPLFQELRLSVTPSMIPGKIYHVNVSNLEDCHQNRMANTMVPAGLPVEAKKTELVINEILFNPRPGGEDYVELFNAGNNIMDAAKVYISNRNSSGLPGTAYPLSEKPFYIFPGQYLVATTSVDAIKRNYLVLDSSTAMEIKTLPSFPDDEGWVIIQNALGQEVDELHYYDDWHFRLIADKEGVSLERLDPTAKTQDQNNWHSSSTSSGYGTPGYKNSQIYSIHEANDEISIEPKIFSPDNDGRDDVVVIHGKSAPGTVTNIQIYNARGMLVRHLVNNAIAGADDHWLWDGLDDAANRLPLGPYVILISYFDLQGHQQQVRKPVILMRPLR